jgi:hypothetical protein
MDPIGSMGSTGLQDGPIDESEGCDGPQRGEGDSAGDSKGLDGL